MLLAVAMAMGSLSLFFFLGRDYFPEIPSNVIQMQYAPARHPHRGVRRIATLVSRSIEELLPGQVENIVSNCGLPVGPHNLAFIPTPTIGPQGLRPHHFAPAREIPGNVGVSADPPQGIERTVPGTEFTFQPLISQPKYSTALAPIDVQVNGPDIYPNHEFARKLADRFRTIPGAADVVIQQTMRTPTLMVEGDRTFGLGVN
ncbi:MAG: hypothetical protein U0361_20655 [Nitrospiraceae bacterium]